MYTTGQTELKATFNILLKGTKATNWHTVRHNLAKQKTTFSPVISLHYSAEFYISNHVETYESKDTSCSGGYSMHTVVFSWQDMVLIFCLCFHFAPSSAFPLAISARLSLCRQWILHILKFPTSWLSAVVSILLGIRFQYVLSSQIITAFSCDAVSCTARSTFLDHLSWCG